MIGRLWAFFFGDPVRRFRWIGFTASCFLLYVLVNLELFGRSEGRVRGEATIIAAVVLVACALHSQGRRVTEPIEQSSRRAVPPAIPSGLNRDSSPQPGLPTDDGPAFEGQLALARARHFTDAPAFRPTRRLRIVPPPPQRVLPGFEGAASPRFPTCHFCGIKFEYFAARCSRCGRQLDDETVRRPSPGRRRRSRDKSATDDQGRLDFLPGDVSVSRQPGAFAATSAYSDAPVATPLHRILAGFLDASLILVTGAALVLAIVMLFDLPVVVTRDTVVMGCGGLILVGVIYGGVWIIAGKATPGMRWARLRLATFDGLPPEPRQLWLRLAGTFLSATSIIGLLWPLSDEEGLAWQDHISRTFPTPVDVDAVPSALEHSHSAPASSPERDAPGQEPSKPESSSPVDHLSARRRVDYAIGIDAGSAYARCIVGLVDGSTFRLLGFGESRAEGWDDGRIADGRKVAIGIAACVREASTLAQVPIEAAVIGIGGPAIRTAVSRGVVEFGRRRKIQLNDINRAVDAARRVSLPDDQMVLYLCPQEFVLDGMPRMVRDPINLTASRIELNAALVLGSTQEHTALTSALNEVHVAVEDSVFEAQAACYSTVPNRDMANGTAVIDIGAESTGIVTYEGGILRHAAGLPIGGNNFTRDIAIALSLPFGEAELVKLEAGRATRDGLVDLQSRDPRGERTKNWQFVSEILRARATELFVMVKAELARAGWIPPTVVLAGGTSKLSGLCDIAEQVLERQAGFGLPWGVQGLPSALYDPSWATTVGLAMFSARMRPTSGAARNTRALTRRE